MKSIDGESATELNGTGSSGLLPRAMISRREFLVGSAAAGRDFAYRSN